jgi:5-(carboxyamino)imidazole ribonucleotide synthase
MSSNDEPNDVDLKNTENLELRTNNSLGILGGGQLGAMMAEAAHKMGFRVVIYDQQPEAPAFSIADKSIVASFEDHEALQRFAAEVDLITLEFENIPLSTLTFLEKYKPLFPSAAVVRCCQDRLLEKNFLQSHGFPVAPYTEVTSEASLHQALKLIGTPSLLKTATLGYDGKGQIALDADSNAAVAWQELRATRAVLEKKIAFTSECSVIVARSQQGENIVCSIQENIHRDGILDCSVFPPRLEKQIQTSAEVMAKKIAEALGVIGLLAIEFFVMPDGSLLVNELAPRPHNSGHHTLESMSVSQFEQVITAITGRPLITPEKHADAIMVNLLGELWSNGEPDWKALRANPNAHLHLYGKKEARPGRKMGHVTFTSEAHPS